MQKSRATRVRRVLRRVALGLAILLMLVSIAGGLWNVSVVRRLRKANPPPGWLYAVNGRKMHLYCTGTGNPTVVLEAGFGEDFTVWGKVQPALSSVTRVCSYDRAGFGWSDTQPGVPDADHVADALHRLLQQAGLSAPVILVGHSFGGIYIRDYVSRFPHAVAGLVFLDATSPTPLPKPASMATLDEHGAVEFAMVRVTIDLGFARMAGMCDTVPPGFGAYAGWIHANACVPSQVEAYIRAYGEQASSMAKAARTRTVGDLPVLVFSQDPQRPRPPILERSVSIADWQIGMVSHDAEQEALKKLSPRNYRIVAKGSGHYIHYDRPELLVREVGSLVRQIRDGTSTWENGTTKIE